MSNTIIQTIWVERKKIGLIFILAVVFYVAFYYSVEEHHFKLKEFCFHISAEFIGSIIVFIILENGIQRIEQLSFSGIKEKINGLPKEEFLEQIKQSKSKLEIIDTYLKSFVIDDFKFTSFKQSLNTILNNDNIEVTILIIDPESDAAKQRAEELNKDRPELILKEMRKCVRRLHHYKEEIVTEFSKKSNISNLFTILVYDATPPFAMYSWDKNAYVSFFPRNMESVSSPQLFIPSETEFGLRTFSFFESKFDELARDEKTLTIEKYFPKMSID